MKSYLLVADVLGFSNIVSNLHPNHLSRRMATWLHIVEETSREMEIKDIQLVSDTIFVREVVSEDGLQRLFQFSKLLLQRGMQNSFPIRGAITFGELTWGKLIYGEAVIEAYNLERSLDWIGIACGKLPDVPWSWDLACYYLVPKKGNEKATFSVAIPWPILEIETKDFRGKWTSGGLLKNKEDITWASYSKLFNTLLFFKYARQCMEENLQPNKFNSEVYEKLYLT
ncbi:MAG: hypothetical protein OXG62_07015 [Nitrospinae bacterium]|nr:hypothetical protein [Nitrospinota bacterium]